MTDADPTAKIFISYRRADSADVCGRIYDRLAQHFGAEAVFRDVHDIPPGDSFKRRLETALAQCAVELVVIGPGWLDATDDEGQRRLGNPDDFVRTEVERGLDRDILVIPLLVSGAAMPSADQLPRSLAKLADLIVFDVQNR